MQACHAHIQTHKPERLMTRLCKHWGHKFEVSLTDRDGEIALPMGSCRLHCPGEGLDVELQGESDTMARFQQVVADHLQRMAGGDELIINWECRA